MKNSIYFYIEVIEINEIMKRISIILVLLYWGVTMNTYSQHDGVEKRNRKPVVAGKFYPAQKQVLNNDLQSYFKKASGKEIQNTISLIAPHAGYVFSGEVAACSYNQIDEDKTFENIFILASSHHAAFKGASIYNIGDYETPLGEVPVNIQLANKLIKQSNLFDYHPQAHTLEHSLEVQLPLLQYKLNTNFQIVPIVIGTQEEADCRKMSEVLKPYFNANNLFVISTDFSHYPHYEAAKQNDQVTADAVASNQPERLIRTLEENMDKNIANLATSLCGWSSVLTLMYMTSEMSGIEYHQIRYNNSGDTEYGDKERVVGYYSIAVSQKKDGENSIGFNLSAEEKVKLLTIARNTITGYLTSGKMPTLNDEQFSSNLKSRCGAFVTLHKKGELRGCIGQFNAKHPLYKTVQEMAVSASTNDNRFLPVATDEINELEIEISVLTPLRRIKSIEEFELGRHGIYIKAGYRTGTFLPQVAESTGWSTEEFFGHCARDKAGLDWDGWKNAELYTYEAIVFSESELLH